MIHSKGFRNNQNCIDEITMMNKFAFKVIERCLRVLTGSNLPFGFKTIVVGGDFRKVLCVIVRGSRTEIISNCVIATPLWNLFEVITLQRIYACHLRSDVRQLASQTRYRIA